MVKAVSDGFLDGTLDAIAASNRISVCSAQPANVAAIAGLTLATTGMVGGDFTKANGDTSGRKVTVGQKADISITASGTATHVVIDDGTDLYITTCTSIVLTSGGTVTSPAWDIEIADPV